MTSGKSRHRHGGVAIMLHWTIAVALPILIVLGLAARSSEDPARQVWLLRVHVPLGIAVLALAVARVVWRSVDRRPDPLPGPLWQQVTARMVHLLLLALPIVAGASGLALMILSGAGPAVLSSVPSALPRFAALPPMAAHAATAFALIALIGLHVGAALYHQIFRRDRVLARMGIGRSLPEPVPIPEEVRPCRSRQSLRPR